MNCKTSFSVVVVLDMINGSVVGTTVLEVDVDDRDGADDISFGVSVCTNIESNGEVGKDIGFLGGGDDEAKAGSEFKFKVEFVSSVISSCTDSRLLSGGI